MYTEKKKADFASQNLASQKIKLKKKYLIINFADKIWWFDAE